MHPILKHITRPSWLYFFSQLNPFHGALELHEGTLEEICRKTDNPDRLALYYGPARVLRFYDEQVLPTLRRLKPGTDVWRTRFEVGFQAVQLEAKTSPSRAVFNRIAALMADLILARFDDDVTKNTAVRCQTREALGESLLATAEWLRRQGDLQQALEAYQLLERLGCMTPACRATYVHLLWKAKDYTPSATRVYLRYLGDHGWSLEHAPVLLGMDTFVQEQMTIDDRVSRNELPFRTQCNELALCGTNAPKNAALQAGLGYLRLDRPDRALDYFRLVPQNNGMDAGRLAFYMGQAHFKKRAYQDATHEFNRAVELDFSRSQIASWLGMAYAELKDYDRARQEFLLAEEELGDALEGDFYVQWGRTSYLVGDTEDAEQRFRLALHLQQENAHAAYGLAICLVTSGRRAEAVAVLRDTVAHAPDFAPAVHGLGQIIQADGHQDEALTCFRKAVDLRPEDTEYLLSLGLLLDDREEHEGITYLEKVAEAGAGGPEVLRRVVIGYMRSGQRNRARRWLQKLAAHGRSSETVALYFHRDLVSQATEAFNAGRYPKAIEKWRQAARTFPGAPWVNAHLSQAQLFDAATRLGRGEGDGAWEQIQEAHARAPSPESRFLYSFYNLVQANYPEAHQLFTALQLEFPDRTDYSFFEALAAFFNGDQEALERLTQFNPVAEAAYLRALQAFLQVYVAALNGPPEQAAEAARAWISNPDMVRQLGLGTQQINRFAALCILHGAGRRKQRVRNLFNRLCAQYEEGFWDLANALVRHRLAVMSGVEHAKWEDLEACDQAYQKLLDASRPEERPLIHQEYAGLLRFKVRLALQENDIENGLDLLGRLEELTTPIPPEVKALRNLLEKRMARPSHEKAYAVMDRNPDAARTVWLTLLERDPRDPIILQHLACLAWSHAYDAVLAEDYDASVPFWKEGLAWYQQVFLQPAYWEQLRLKGQTLGKMSGCEFDEQAFNTWRQDALYLTAHTMLDLIFHVMAGFDPANRSSKLEKPVGIARALMRVIRKFEAIDPEEKYTLRNRLSVDLAKHYLDPDPTNLTDLDTSLARAILVLDIDPDNVPARSFMLRATTHHVYISSKEGDRDFPKLFNRLDGLKTQAEWLEERLDTFESELRSRIRGDLASYYDQMGEIKHDEGQYVTSKINEAIRRGIITEILIRAEQMQACYQVSDAHFKKSLDLDPATARAGERIQHHSRESQALSDLLRQVRGY